MEQIINIIGTLPVWVTAGILLFIVFFSLKEGANAARESHSYDEDPHADPAYREYLEQFDDGDYYSDERGDGGLISFAFMIVVSSAISIGGIFAGYATNATVGWLIAGLGLAFCAYDAGKRGTHQRLNRFARLRAEADKHEPYETACVAEEKLVPEGNETKETAEPQAKAEPKEEKPGTTFGFIFRLIVAGPMILLLLTLPFSGGTFGATIVAYIIAALLTWWLHNYATRVPRPLKQRKNISSEDRNFYELE